METQFPKGTFISSRSFAAGKQALDHLLDRQKKVLLSCCRDNAHGITFFPSLVAGFPNKYLRVLPAEPVREHDRCMQEEAARCTWVSLRSQLVAVNMRLALLPEGMKESYWAYLRHGRFEGDALAGFHEALDQLCGFRCLSPEERKHKRRLKKMRQQTGHYLPL